MAANNFKVFNESKTNVMNDTDYGIHIQRKNGVSSGLAVSALHNKLYRQTSIAAKAVADFIASQELDATDNDSVLFSTNLLKALEKVTKVPLEGHRTKGVLDHPDSSVTTPKIANRNITTEKIAYNSVGTDELKSEVFNNHNADVNAHSPITDMIASITGESNWQTVPTHNLTTIINESVKRAVDIVGGRADVILTPLIDWERLKTENGGKDVRTGDTTDNYSYALMNYPSATGGLIYLKTAFTDYDEIIFKLTNDDRVLVFSCTYSTKEFYELLNDKCARVYIGGGKNNYWGFGTFKNSSTVNCLATGGDGWENCGLVEIYGVTYPRA